MKRIFLQTFFPGTIMLLLIVSACRNPMGVQPLEETPTRGKIKISVDESFQLLYDTQLYTFGSFYKDAKIFGFDRGGYSASNFKKAKNLGMWHVGIAPTDKTPWTVSD